MENSYKKYTMSVFGLFAVCLLVIASCDSVTNTGNVATTGLENAVVAEQAAKGGKWIHNVTGGGKDFYPGETKDASFEITFNAKKDADGNVKGKVKWNFLDGTPASYGSVQCLEVRDNRAYMTYIAEGGNWDPGYGTPGNTVYLAFEDNGEGTNAPLDRQSFIYVGGNTNNCDVLNPDFFDTQGFPVEWVNGNVQVR